jgi:biotin carboxylase
VSPARPRLLVVGTGSRTFKEFLLDWVSRHFRVHLFPDGEPTWELDYVDGYSTVNLRETRDATQLCEVAVEQAAIEPFAGVLAWDEARVLQVAKMVGVLGLPGWTPEVAIRCREKDRTRAALAAAGIPQPRWALVSDVDEAVAAAESIGFPVVVKPRAMAASLGVVRVDSAAELGDRFAFARDVAIPGSWRYDQVLVEEFLTGPEISVDSAVHARAVHPMFVARKEIGFAPYFEEVGHTVDGADPLLVDPVVGRLLADVHAALGCTDGMTHTELKLTADGPKVIEVNGRLGGDLIPYLGWHATGIDPGLVAGEIACGRSPTLTPRWRRVGAVRFHYVERDDTRIEEIRVDRDRLSPAVDRFEVVARPGAVVSPPPKGTLFGRLAYVTAVGESAAECRQALDSASGALVVRTAAPVTTPGAAHT